MVRRYGAPIDRVLALLDRADEIEGPSLPLRALRTYTQIMQMRAGIKTDAHNLALAESDARAMLKEAPNAPYGHALLGFIAYERGDLPGAVRGLTHALERDASDTDARFFLGIALEAAGQHEASIATGLRFRELDPLSPLAGILLGSCYWFVGRPGERLDALEHAASLDPDNPILCWSVGYTYALLGQRDSARAQAEWMQNHAPQMPYTAHFMALVYAMDGRSDDAIAVLRTIGEMTFDAHLTFHLSEPYALAGDKPTALLLLADAVERGFYSERFHRGVLPVPRAAARQRRVPAHCRASRPAGG